MYVIEAKANNKSMLVNEQSYYWCILSQCSTLLETRGRCHLCSTILRLGMLLVAAWRSFSDVVAVILRIL